MLGFYIFLSVALFTVALQSGPCRGDVSANDTHVSVTFSFDAIEGYCMLEILGCVNDPDGVAIVKGSEFEVWDVWHDSTNATRRDAPDWVITSSSPSASPITVTRPKWTTDTPQYDSDLRRSVLNVRLTHGGVDGFALVPADAPQPYGPVTLSRGPVASLPASPRVEASATTACQSTPPACDSERVSSSAVAVESDAVVTCVNVGCDESNRQSACGEGGGLCRGAWEGTCSDHLDSRRGVGGSGGRLRAGAAGCCGVLLKAIACEGGNPLVACRCGNEVVDCPTCGGVDGGGGAVGGAPSSLSVEVDDEGRVPKGSLFVAVGLMVIAGAMFCFMVGGAVVLVLHERRTKRTKRGDGSEGSEDGGSGRSGERSEDAETLHSSARSESDDGGSGSGSGSGGGEVEVASRKGVGGRRRVRRGVRRRVVRKKGRRRKVIDDDDDDRSVVEAADPATPLSPPPKGLRSVRFADVSEELGAGVMEDDEEGGGGGDAEMHHRLAERAAGDAALPSFAQWGNVIVPAPTLVTFNCSDSPAIMPGDASMVMGRVRRGTVARRAMALDASRQAAKLGRAGSPFRGEEGGVTESILQVDADVPEEDTQFAG